MEEIIQALLEIGLQILGELPWEAALTKSDRQRQKKGRPGLDDAVIPCALLSLLVGVAFGGVSLWLFPHSFFHAPWLRVLNLVLSPLATATLSCLMAAYRRKKSPGTSPRSHFIFSFLFSLNFALIRFLCI
ncbi:hypothetical protein SAMN05444156_1213 [Verrucomicrobium sp. GAS474]|uniref:hypothetical protein n=1 Tax=Verrucomicrobium sp. GAS474 TaxID=1882831 RepID=UPI00087AF1F5|nr:hypothetical protein [Verrucomicrobium sp. GAS474]SDT97859.1 hypothetical protein SAMN05444156_1213 [Verrucomicrobium sp. GAS474]